MGKRKGQTSVEFIVILIVVAGLLLIVSNSLKIVELSSLSNQDELSAREIGDYVAAKINEVYIAGNGAEVNVALPDKLGKGKDYAVNLYPDAHLVEVRWDNRGYTSPVVIGDVNGSVGRNFKVVNHDGEVKIF